MSLKILFLGLFFLHPMLFLKASNPELYFPNLKVDKGNILIAVFDQSGNEIELHVVPVASNEIRVKLNKLEAGKKYAVKAFHDVNGNKELDTNLFGVPTEPYGFSNNARGVFGPPSLNQMIFTAEANKTIEINLH